MVDKRVNKSTGGTLNTGVATATFDIPLASGSLLYTEAVYLFEFNIVMYSASPSTLGNVAKAYLYAKKSSGSITLDPTDGDMLDGYTAIVAGDQPGGSITTLTASVVSGNIRVTMTTNSSLYDRTWRAFITCYIKDGS